MVKLYLNYALILKSFAGNARSLLKLIAIIGITFTIFVVQLKQQTAEKGRLHYYCGIATVTNRAWLAIPAGGAICGTVE